MPWGGAKSAAWRTCLPRTWSLTNAAHRRIVQDFWRSPRIASTAGTQGRRAVPGDRGGTGQGGVDHGDESGRQPPGCRSGARRARAMRAGGRVGRRGEDRHHAFAHVLLPAAAWGEKDGTVTNSERRISRQRRSSIRPAKRGRTGGRWAKSRKRMGFAAAFDFASAHEIFSEHARLSAASNEGTRASISAGSPSSTRAEFDALRAGAVAGAARARRAGHAPALFESRALLPSRWPGALLAHAAARAGVRRRRRVPARPQHRSHPRPVAHDDAHRPLTPALRTHARAVRRPARAGRAASRRARGRARSRDDAVGFPGRAPANERRHRARHAVRSDPLERGERLRRRASAHW